MDVQTIKRICAREGLIIMSLEVSNHAKFTDLNDEPRKWQIIILKFKASSEHYELRSDFLSLLSEMRIGDFVPVRINCLPGEMTATVKYSVDPIR